MARWIPRWPVAGGLGLMATLSSCAPTPRPPDTAVVASGADLEDVAPVLAVHPLTRQVHRHLLYLTLVRLDSTLGMVPSLARRWEWSTDRRAVTMHLTTAVRWHDGYPTTARDLVFTLETVMDSTVGSPRAGELRALTSVRAVDDSTLRLTFASPQDVLPLVLAELPILPAHRWAGTKGMAWRTTSASERSVGNGPFRLERRVRGESWVFVRNPDFPAELGGPPTLARLVVTVVDEPTTKVAGLVSGALDMAGVSPTMASLVARDSSLRLVSPPVLFSTLLVMHTGRPPFDDVRVRRALSLALHRQRLIDVGLSGFGVPAASAVPPRVLPTVPAPPREAAVEAARLLDAAGWIAGADGRRRRAGRELEVELWTVGSGDLAIEQLIQADLAAVGIMVRLRAQEFTSLLAALRAPLSARPFDLALTGIPGDLALGHLEALLHSRGAGGALDLGKLHAPALDAAIDAARRLPVREAGAAWDAVDARLDSLMPVVWLYHARGVQGHTRRLRHVAFDLRGELATVARWQIARE